MRTGLAVLVDGVALPEEEARGLWQRFSDWMEEHRGDLAGFAAKEGFASIRPSVDRGTPVLVASKSAPQEPYGPARAHSPPAAGVAQPAHRSGGSERRHDHRPSNRSGRRSRQK